MKDNSVKFEGINSLISYIRCLFKYKDYIIEATKNDLLSKYKNSILGGIWSIINPLVIIFIYTIVFSQVMKSKFPGVNSEISFGLFICSGMISWNYFSEIINRLTGMFVDNAGLLKKMSLPKLVIFIIPILSCSINFFIIETIFYLICIFFESEPINSLPWIGVLLLIQVAISVGLGMILAVLNVYAKDTSQMLSVVLQFWFWLTPIVYPASALPESLVGFTEFNPMAKVIYGFQNIFLYDLGPNIAGLIYPAVVGLILIVTGFLMVKRNFHSIMDEI